MQKKTTRIHLSTQDGLLDWREDHLLPGAIALIGGLRIHSDQDLSRLRFAVFPATCSSTGLQLSHHRRVHGEFVRSVNPEQSVAQVLIIRTDRTRPASDRLARQVEILA